MVEICLGKHIGFCWGVERVLEMVKGLLEKGKRVHVFGDLVHNDFVIEKLRDAGVVFHRESEIDDVGRLDGVVVIRAHGVPPEERRRMEKVAAEVYDGTCPIVSRLFEIGKSMEAEGYRVCVYGNPDHPEMRAFKGYVKSAIFYPDTCDEKRVAVLAQTTADFSKFKAYADSLIDSGRSEVRVINTICSETLMREEEVKKMARECGLVLVIGGKKSSNTRKLYEIAKAHGEAVWVESVDELEGDLRGRIGIVSGTSTPMEVVRRITNHIEWGGRLK